MTLDEATKALIAAKKLERLYNAYRATSRASGMTLNRIKASYEKNEDIIESERNRIIQRLVGEIALSHENDLLFADRVDQIRRRIVELEGIIP